jgi:hypothetical protein
MYIFLLSGVEPIQFLPGQRSLETTERCLGSREKIVHTVSEKPGYRAGCRPGLGKLPRTRLHRAKRRTCRPLPRTLWRSSLPSLLQGWDGTWLITPVRTLRGCWSKIHSPCMLILYLRLLTWTSLTHDQSAWRLGIFLPSTTPNDGNSA